MNNFFNFAYKELAQDSFLMWVFDNYADEDVGQVAYALLRKFCNLSATEKIKKLNVEPQRHKIDVTVEFETDENRNIRLFIEDKTDSCEHFQLERYNKFAYGEDKEIYRIFYKSGYVNDYEKERAKRAGWTLFGINDIIDNFAPFENSTNFIVSQYVEHIKLRAQALTETEKPDANDKIDYLRWLSFFERTVIPRLDIKNGNVSFRAGKAGQYPYINLCARYKGREKIPFLEIRSRDCIQGKFKALFVCYGMEYCDVPKQKELIEKIKASDKFVCKNLKYSHNGKEIFPKQIGYSKNGLSAANTEEFVLLVKEYVDEYIKLMQDWEI